MTGAITRHLSNNASKTFFSIRSSCGMFLTNRVVTRELCFGTDMKWNDNSLITIICLKATHRIKIHRVFVYMYTPTPSHTHVLADEPVLISSTNFNINDSNKKLSAKVFSNICVFFTLFFIFVHAIYYIPIIYIHLTVSIDIPILYTQYTLKHKNKFPPVVCNINSLNESVVRSVVILNCSGTEVKLKISFYFHFL